MATLFGRDYKTISKHISNALKEDLADEVVVAKFANTTQHGAIEGKRTFFVESVKNMPRNAEFSCDSKLYGKNIVFLHRKYQMFRRMVFNVLSNNTDDHNKNFSFIMQRDGSWRLSPAYDITYILDSGGYLPNEDHCLYVRAKLRSITYEDVVQFARDNGIRRPDAIIRDVIEALKEFRSVATKNGVRDEWIGRVEATITNHLKSWGECTCCALSSSQSL